MSVDRSIYRLRTRLRKVALAKRVRLCGRVPYTETPVVRVSQTGEQRTGALLGLATCGAAHSCPVCAAQRNAMNARKVQEAVLASGGVSRWQLLTLTLRHSHTDKLRDLVQLLFDAWRRVRATRRVREVFDRRVSATIRALEVTWGTRAGWHPHLHIGLCSSEWSEDEKAILLEEWRAAVGPERVVEDERADRVSVDWQSFHHASYLTKFAPELAGIGKKSRRGGLSVWEVADRAADEHARGGGMHVALWEEYQHAMKGRRVFELDERANALRAFADVVDDADPDSIWDLTVCSEEFVHVARLERIAPDVVWRVLDVLSRAAGPDPTSIARRLFDRLLSVDPWTGTPVDLDWALDLPLTERHSVPLGTSEEQREGPGLACSLLPVHETPARCAHAA